MEKVIEAKDDVLISVILPVYNAEKYIKESIESILNQTYENFELIIINDGSTDDTEMIIKSFSDKRIRYYTNNKNEGLIYTLNRGLELSQGDFIARMDSDDICLPERFFKQINAFLEDNNLIVCGSQILKFGENIKSSKSNYFLSNELIKYYMIYNCPFAHPSVMLRKSVLLKFNIKYNNEYLNAEDYKLWFDLMHFGTYRNLSDVLLKYRISDTQITQSSNKAQIMSAIKCRRAIFEDRTKLKLPESIDFKFIKENEDLLIKYNLYGIAILSLEKYNFSLLPLLLKNNSFFKLSLKDFLRLIKRGLYGPCKFI